MNERVEVTKEKFMDFIQWAKENIDGLHQYSIMVADRVVVKDGQDKLIAYINLAYETNYYIDKNVYNVFDKS